MKNTIQLLFVAISVFNAGCQVKKESVNTQTPHASEAPVAEYTQCHDPRSKICTREYHPVCATRDNGIRCVTTPCPSTDKVTKPNACVACSDNKVLEFTEGACK